jgi:ferredoxin
VQMAEDHDLEMPVSCCSGACFVCACKIKEWYEHIDIAKLSVPLVDIDEDQVLACVWWVKESAFSDWMFHRIVLQKLM